MKNRMLLENYLNTFIDVEKNIYVQELELIQKQGLCFEFSRDQIFLKLRYLSDPSKFLYNLFDQVGSIFVDIPKIIRSDRDYSHFLRSSYTCIGAKFFTDDIYDVSIYVNNKEIFRHFGDLKKEVNFRFKAKHLIEIFWGKKLSMNIRLLQKGQERKTQEVKEKIFNANCHLDDCLRQSKFWHDQWENYSFMHSLIQQRKNNVISYEKNIFENACLIKNFNVVELRTIWLNLWSAKELTNDDLVRQCSERTESYKRLLDYYFGILLEYKSFIKDSEASNFLQYYYLLKYVLK